MQSIRTIGISRDIPIMRDHDDRILRLRVELGDQLHDLLRIGLIEIACRLIGEEIWYI
jgi:hypothetical protein